MSAGAIASNIVHFTRGLRRAGLPIGSGQVIDALRATEWIDLSRRDDFYWGLASVLIHRHAHLNLFDIAFRYFWEQKPFVHREGVGAADATTPDVSDEVSQRVLEAFARSAAAIKSDADESPTVKLDATFTTSRREQLQVMDFQSMSIKEIREAKRMLARLRLPVPEVKTRRSMPDTRGTTVDLRATLRASLRGQGELLLLQKRSPRFRHPPLVVLCDISGSMNRYAEMLLHFLHAITNDRDRVHVFLFGTRLTNATRQLRHRDVDAALQAVSRTVEDWSGGTRIGTSLLEFNQRWSRRVLGQNALVLMITDGLERDGGAVLGHAMERLNKSCRKLIWLNPLLRFEGFEPLATGVRLMLPHVDEFRPAHNVASLMDLADALTPNHTSPNSNTRKSLRWK